MIPGSQSSGWSPPWRTRIWKKSHDMKMQTFLANAFTSNTHIWLVVWTPLKNISQLGWFFPIYGKIKNVPNHQPDMFWHIPDMTYSEKCTNRTCQNSEIFCQIIRSVLWCIFWYNLTYHIPEHTDIHWGTCADIIWHRLWHISDIHADIWADITYQKKYLTKSLT